MKEQPQWIYMKWCKTVIFSSLQDKTFGLKNKKGAKQQTFIKSVQHQVKYGNQKATKVTLISFSYFKARICYFSILDWLISSRPRPKIVDTTGTKFQILFVVIMIHDVLVSVLLVVQYCNTMLMDVVMEANKTSKPNLGLY